MCIAPPTSCAELLTKFKQCKAIAPPLIPELFTKDTTSDNVMVLKEETRADCWLLEKWN